MAKVMRRLKVPTQFDESMENRLRATMTRTFSNADKSNLDNSLHLAGSKKLGKPAEVEAIIALAKRTREPGVAIRLLLAEYNTQDRSSAEQLLRAALGMVTLANKQTVLASSEDVSIEIVLAAFFVNRILADPEGAVRKLAELDVDPIKKVVRLFLSWWSTLDVTELRKTLEPKSTSSSRRVTFCKAEDTPRGTPTDSILKYDVKVNGKCCGHVHWASKESESPNPKSFGWVVELHDGFNESGFRTGKNKSRPSDPFTAVHNGELKLLNPTRLTMRLAQQWAREALRV